MSALRKRSHRLVLEALEDRCLLSGDAVLDWNAVLLQANATDHGLARPDQGGPGRTARAFAIVHAAIYDAVNSIDRTHTPYLARVPAFRIASMEAAVAQAAHDTLVALYPQQRNTFDRELRQSLRGIPLLRAGLGQLVGLATARNILAARAGDGSGPDGPYEPVPLPGYHQVDPLHPGQGFLGPQWGGVKPFALTDSGQFAISDRVDPREDFLASPEYTAAYEEVLAYGAKDSAVRTADQTEIGIYWGYDGSPGLGTPPRLYNQIARTIAEQQGNTMVQNARLFALLNFAQADAGMECWYDKYVFQVWRPVVGVRAGDTDGNPATVGDPTWEPLGAPCSNGCGAVTNFTPPFPAYASGHATFGAATFQTLARFYGTDQIPFTFVSDEYNGVTLDQDGTARPLRPRSFTSFSQASEENGQSRIYLGIHWSFDKTEGINQGNQIADYVFDNYLLPRGHGPGGGDSDPGFDVGLLTASPLAAVVGTPGQEAAGTRFDALASKDAWADARAGAPVITDVAAVDDADSGQAPFLDGDVLFGAPELLAAQLGVMV